MPSDKIEIVYKKLSELHGYENNPRKNQKAVQPVANSIEEFGFKVPMVITADGTIVTGHTRYAAAQELGMEEVPCILADDLTDEQISAFRVADNRVSEFASWDFTKLEDELGKISMDMTLFGFDGDWDVNLDDFFVDKEESEDKEPEEKEPEKIKCPHCGEWIEL